MTHSLTIPGTPVAWARTTTWKGRRLTPKRYRQWKMRLSEEMAFSNIPTTDAPCALEIVFVFPRPQKAPKGNTRLPHHRRPDLDNLVKAVMDAGNDVLWSDDGRVFNIDASKYYGKPGEKPHTQIELYVPQAKLGEAEGKTGKPADTQEEEG